MSICSFAVAAWALYRGRLKVRVTLNTASLASGSGTFPLAKVSVNCQGRTLTVEDISMEWISPQPRPASWGWGAPSIIELGLPKELAETPVIAEMVAPLPPQAPYYLQDGETKEFTVSVRVGQPWGNGTEWGAELRAHVRMSNRKQAYVSNPTTILLRPEVLAEAFRQAQEK